MDELGSCGGLIKQIHDALEKSANNAMRPQGMTMAQYGVLLALNRAENGTLPLKELEQLLRVAQSTAAGIVARLEQKGFVEGFGDPAERRAHHGGGRGLLPSGGAEHGADRGESAVRPDGD